MGVDGYICRKRSNVYEYYLKDAHGDVMYAMNQIGGRVSQYGYNVWGEGTTEYNLYSGINQTPIRYSGQYYDYESGMTYLRARYYDSEIKRFTTEDPAKDGVNWYAYCGNNPVNFVDPSGYITEEEQQMYENGQMSPGAYSFLMVCTYYYYLEDTEEGKAWWNKQAENFRNSGYTDTNNEYWNWVISCMEIKPDAGVISQDEHYFRNNLNIEFEWDDFQKLQSKLPENLKWEVVISVFHQHHTVNGEANVKYVSSCGHFEVVYNANNELQNQSNNLDDMGTYNYYSPVSSPWAHAYYDVRPYNKWGNVPGSVNYLTPEW